MRTSLFTKLTSGALFTVVVALPACSSGTADVSVTVTGTDDACSLSNDIIEAGRIDFEFDNQSADVNELYVLRENGDVVREVENVTTGTRRTLSLDLVAGKYEVLCKPGQTGDGFSSPFQVTGEGGTAELPIDREITFDAVDFTYENLDLGGLTSGTTVRFEMMNTGSQPHEFEVLDPNGDAIGEVAAVEPGESGGATVTFETPGTYTYQCILIDPVSKKKHTMLGMTGEFEVG